MTNELMTFSESMVAHRRLSGLTAKVVASAVGMSPQYVSDIECGHRQPPVDPSVVRTWAITIGVDPDIAMRRAAWARCGMYAPVVEKMIRVVEGRGGGE